MSDFRIEGVGCWCPGSRTLAQMRASGHTDECRRAREGWEANYRHLSQLARERAVAQEIGRQVLADARASAERA